MKQPILVATIKLLCIVQLIGQNTSQFFQKITPDQVVLGENTRRGVFPLKFDTYQLDFEGIKAKLATAPWEFTPEADRGKCIVEIPYSNGEFEPFSVFEVAQLDEEGRAQFPDIHCYAGISKIDPRRTVRFSTTMRGFRAMVMQPDYSVRFVEPYAWGQTTYYLTYDMQDYPNMYKGKLRTEIAQNGEVVFGEPYDLPTDNSEAESRGVDVDPVKLKIFRFATSCTGYFGQDHGTTKPEVFAAITEYVNFVSAVYERDIDLRLQLIAGSQNAVFLDPTTDPFQGVSTEQLLDENPDVLNLYCNTNSHDLGHVLTRNVGAGVGVGALAVACTPSKGKGCTAGQGVGDYGPFFLVVLGQETGHQLSAGHSWNNCGDNAQREGTEAYEPGSGSTIMSYAGACGVDNVQNDADLYFHAGSINKIKTYYTFGATCGSYQQTTNNPPAVTLPYQDNFFIPISTPFELNGSATDADNDALTYCWEEYDLGPPTSILTPAGNSPLFRTRPPVDVTNRYFPRLQTVINNAFDKTEQLPTYSRDLTFRLTARDNRPNGGGLGHAQVAFKSFDGAGPFVVQSPNTSTTIWYVGELAEVQWDVANTYAAPVNCKTVNIRLSTDGGQTYPITLASGVVNDGKQFVTVPDAIGSNLRVRIDAADNVFYDISNQNFKIQAPAQPALSVGLSADNAEICMPANFSTEIYTAAVLGYSDPIQLQLVGSLPPGAVASFNTTNIQPGQSASLMVDLTNVNVEGIFTFDVQAVSGSQTYTRPITLTLRRNDFTGFALHTPANGLTNAGLTQTLRWTTGLDADLYDIQLSTSPDFNTLVASRTGTALDSFRVTVLLEKGKAYFWRVRPINECGAHAWSDPYFFSTFAEDCRTFESNDLPKNLSANSTPTIETKITINQGGTISDINIKQIDGYHEFFKDLEAHLISPSGTDLLLWKDKCGNFNGNFNFGLDDSAPGAFQCPPNNTGTAYRPVNALTVFNNQNSTGIWTFRVKDNVSGSGGALEAFKIELCASLAVTPPFLVINNIMPLPSGTSRVITPDFLLVEDTDNTHAELKYTVMTVPERGSISRAGVGVLQPGSQFTQANLDAGEITFQDFGVSGQPDGFYFMVTDGEGGFFGTPKFIAQPLVGTREPSKQTIEFLLFPNPAGKETQLAFSEPLDSDTRIAMTDMAGRILGEWLLGYGGNNLHLDLTGLPQGVYLIVVNNAEGRGIKKLVVR